MKWICLIALCTSGKAWPQAASNNGGNAAALEILNYIHAVNSLDTTLAFYRDVFELTGETRGVLPSPAAAALVNSPGARVRLAVFHLPNTAFGFELMEFSGVERKSGRFDVTDPGAGTLILRVRDLNRVFDAAKKSGVESVTPSGTPVKLRPTSLGSRAILMRDPDGYLVEGEEVSPNGPPSNDNVQSAGVRFAMADRSATLSFYRDLLGLKLTGGEEFNVNPVMSAFVPVPEGSKTRGLGVAAPGKNPLLFYEFQDLPRKQLHLRVPDPGAPAISFRVTNLDALLKQMRAARVPVVSTRGKVVRSSPKIRSIFVEDPSGINVELAEAKDPGHPPAK